MSANNRIRNMVMILKLTDSCVFTIHGFPDGLGIAGRQRMKRKEYKNNGKNICWSGE
jgi:hypothetical protein